MSDPALVELAKREIVAIGLVRAGTITDGTVLRVSGLPVYDGRVS